MKAEEFAKICYEKVPDDYGMCPPPTEAQFGLDILIRHFLGDDWCVTLPLGVKQVNTEAICEILERYPQKRNIGEILKSLFRRLAERIRK